MDEQFINLAISLFKIDCLLFGKFKLMNDVTINAYFDLGIIISHPDILNKMCTLACELLKRRNIRASNICGVSYSAISFAVVIANKLKVPLYLRIKEIQLSSTETRIVGKIEKYAEVVVVEEVLCSGTSTLQVIKDIEDAGMIVKTVLVMIDLEQGGRESLSKLGYNCHTVLKLSEISHILYNNGLINKDRLEDMRQGYSENFSLNGACVTNTALTDRVALSYESRMNRMKSKLSKKLFQLMLKKKTNLCVDLTFPNIDDVISTADDIGSFVCIISIHLNAFNHQPNLHQIQELKRLACKHDFLLMDDRKLSEIGDVLWHEIHKVLQVVDLVTVLPLAYDCIKDVFRFMNSMPEKGIILTASTFTEDALIKVSLEQSTTKSGLSECLNNTLVGFFSHQSSIIPVEYVHLILDMRTTGVTCGKTSTKYYMHDTMTEKLAADIVTIHFADIENIVQKVKEQKYLYWTGYENRFSKNVGLVQNNNVIVK